ncbi:MAG: hypothetical protein LKF39_05845 [Lactococcus raffinolactis]|jgi:hypothetical protein|nr:hypothetical protein [Lactococcus raffinolactis]
MADTAAFEKSCDDSVKQMQELLLLNMEGTLDYLAQKAGNKVGVDTGALRADTKSLGAKIVGDEVHGAVGNTLDYALYHHQGTGIYAIDGNGRKTPWVYEDPRTGKKVFTKGSKPNPYLKDTIEQEQGNIAKWLGGE